MNVMTPAWSPPPGVLHLERNEVHVWRVFLSAAKSELENFFHLLDAKERQRAERYHFQRDRASFITRRGILRTLLGSYLHISPLDVHFRYGPCGKPFLADSASSDLSFNLSHSRDIVLFAFTSGARKVGVDVEYVRPSHDLQEVAARFFSTREVTELSLLPEALQHQMFYSYWVCKEAYLKAEGTGLSMDLDQVEISLSPDHRPVALLSIRGDVSETASWSMGTVDVAPGYAAALAVKDHGYSLSYWQWPSGKQASISTEKPGKSYQGTGYSQNG